MDSGSRSIAEASPRWPKVSGCDTRTCSRPSLWTTPCVCASVQSHAASGTCSSCTRSRPNTNWRGCGNPSRRPIFRSIRSCQGRVRTWRAGAFRSISLPKNSKESARANVIPQRNISLLSNRLAADGGRRIREDVLERDYCLAWFLTALSQSDLKTVLGFKGGTALKRCYFGDYRFSEDLDFTLLEALPLEEILRRLDTVYAEFQRATGGTIRFARDDRHTHV